MDLGFPAVKEGYIHIKPSTQQKKGACSAKKAVD